jgi:peptidoglycan LD-endopeptidase CwlK
VIVFLIIFYFLLVTTVAAWLLLPAVRQWALSQVGTLAAGGAAALPRLHWWLLCAMVLLAAPALALWLRQQHAYNGFDHTTSQEVNAQVAALLAGEQLVPPAPLPPELFLTPEVQQERPSISTASRQWELLDAEFRNRLLLVYSLMKKEHGIDMVLLEGHRTPERQAQLAAMGPQVTHAGAGESYHQYGLAADSAFLFDGRIVISEKDPRAASAYERYGAVAQAAGLVWGGSWRSIKDLGHVELRRPGVLRSARPTDPPSAPNATSLEATK